MTPYLRLCNIFRSPSKRYTRRTIGPCTSRDIMFDSRRSTPMLDGYSGNNQSIDTYSQKSASDGGHYSVSSSSAYSPMCRQPANSWTSYRTSSAAVSVSSPPNTGDSVSRSSNLRSTLPPDYKPTGCDGTPSRGPPHLRSNSSSSSSIAVESRPARTPARSSVATSESGSMDYRTPHAGEPSGGSLRRRRTYDNSRVNGSGRPRSRHREPRSTSEQSSEWQVQFNVCNNNKAQQAKYRWPPRERFTLSATLCFNSMLQCGRCLGYPRMECSHSSICSSF